MTRHSPPGLLALHAVRISGYADTPAIAHRYGLDAAGTKEALLDAEARGWVQHTAFAGSGGWSLTESGRAENERQLAAELARADGADEVRDVYREFLPLNALLLRACTDWQLRPVDGDRLAANDHTDAVWDARILDELAGVDRALAPLVDRLGGVLTRFRGYDTRFAGALARARAGEGAWVDRTDVDSCHRVWFELHEDLIATLGIDRRAHP
ncbi:transcriptional regulator [Nonomuraea sp. SMC257]|uniref:Transcriptional regulator n=1 Tax=Nonomuraea montanisoli TaxID=2741721 RepID=A0A7Y6M3M9_9ACTN|nr:transcriptional regulator [Nonomuraea montanisoli]NUW33888.1 transcriptional regulator [Nonomuraea montanisoli]